jgi:hypothetical protein
VRKLIAAFVLLASLSGAAAAVAAPELSTKNRLDDRRYAAVGTRAYSVGTEAGRFPAMGFHTRGEMGGIWAPPLKLLDGIWFSVDGEPVGPATRFTSGWGYVEMDLPPRPGLTMQRVEFAPDGRRGVLIGLRLTSTGAAREVEIAVDAHSELMSAYPWGETRPNQLRFNLQDTVALEEGRLVFREQGRPPVRNAETHDWAAVVAAPVAAIGGETGAGFRGPQEPPVVCPASSDKRAKVPERCDDTAYGKGAGGRLRYRVAVPAGGTSTLWIAVTGSDEGAGPALGAAGGLLGNPDALLSRKVEQREALARFTRLSLPGDSLLARGIDWSKQNLADSVQIAEDVEIRETRGGKRYRRPEGELGRIRFLGAGWPDYPWLFATDGEYTAFASVAVGQFAPIMDHLRALREVSEIDNGGSGKVVHEVVGDGTVYFGSNADPGNTDETVKFPSAVALLWRWTGSNAFRDELYPFARRGMRVVWSRLDRDRDGWPEGLGNVEREGMGEEKLDVAVYAIRGLLDLADMARSRSDGATRRWAEGRAATLRAAFGEDWWMPDVPGFADSLRGRDGRRVYQRHWIGVTPMEAELMVDGQVEPGLASREHGVASLSVHERRCYANVFGLFHTGGPGCDGAPRTPSEKQPFTLNTAVMAVAEGNYGRLSRVRQGRFTRANRRLQLPVPDEQPGAMPEIAPAPLLNGRSIDRPFLERPMVLQAWGAYGTAWPVVHQHLGVRPDLGRRRLEVTPQLPPYQRRIAGRTIRLGRGSVDVVAERQGGGRYRTVVDADVGLRRLRLGVTLPLGSEVGRVVIDGRTVLEPLTRETNRGLEVLADVGGRASGSHVLVVQSR